MSMGRREIAAHERDRWDEWFFRGARMQAALQVLGAVTGPRRLAAHQPNRTNAPRAHIEQLCAPLWIALLALFAAMTLLLAGCGGNDGTASGANAPARVSEADAEARLQVVVLGLGDVGVGFTQDAARRQTNDEAARARPDTDNARQQYAEWGQVLGYNVQYAAPPTADLVFNAKIARVMNTATYYQTPEGAAAALAYTRGLGANTVANVLVSESSATKITDTQVVKDIAFPSKGDDSYAWRISGKATFYNGFTVTFVADSVFVRAGRIDGNVTAVALGEAPQRAALTALVDTFVARAQEQQ